MEKKFEVIYEENHANILNYVCMRMKNKDIAEELTNDVFIKVYKHLDSYDNTKSAFTSWLMTITNRTIIDYFRTSKKENNVQKVSDFVDTETGKEIFQFVSQNDSEANYQIENKELKKAINKAINKLKPVYKRIAELHFLNGYNYQEVVEATNLPLNSVKTNIHRIREMLQTELKSVRKALV